MAYTRPKTNYRPLQYTPQSYSPLNYEPTPQTQTQPDEDFYRKLLEGTKAPTPPPEPDPAFEYQKRYQDIAGRTPNRLAYQQAVQEGYPEIERGKLSKALALIGAVGGTWATKDPERSTKAAMDAYFAPQNRATARYKEKLTGLENLATMEDKDIAGKIRALEFERGDFYDQQRLKLDRERSARETASDKRDIEGDTLENERRRLLLDDAKIEKRVDDDTGIEYRRPKGSNGEWVAFAKVKPARIESIVYDALAKGEEEKAVEAARQPGRDKALLSKERIATEREIARANASLTALTAKAKAAGATEEFQRQVMNLRAAVINAPYLMEYVKETPIGLVPKDASDFIGGKPDQDDLDAIAKVTAALNQGGPPTPRNTGYKINPHDNTVTFLNPQGERENKSFESVPYWEKQPGYKLETPKSSNPAAPAAAAAVANQTPPPPASVAKYPTNPDGTVTVTVNTGEELNIKPEEVPKFLEDMKDEGGRVKAAPAAAPAAAATTQSTAAPTTSSTTTTTIPPAASPQISRSSLTNPFATGRGAGLATSGAPYSNAPVVPIPPAAPEPASTTPPKEPVAPYQGLAGEGNVSELPFGQAYQRSNVVPRPANNPFVQQAAPPPPAPMPAGPDPNAGMPLPNRIMQNRFGPANLFGANIPLPGANPQQRMPPPQAPAPPIDLMPKPQPQRTPPPPIVPPQQAPLPPNPIQLAPAVNAPAAPPPQAPVPQPAGIQFGPVPQTQRERVPFGQASQLTSPLTNPLSLSGGMSSMDIKIPKPAPKPLAPGSRTPIPPRLAIPERVKDFNTRLESLKAQFKQETGYDIRIDRGGDVTEVEQYQKYLQGRPELPGGKKGPKVTPISGKPGDESTHQYGEGADVIFTKNGKMAPYVDTTKKHQPPNKLGERLYAILGRIAEQKGLEWGGRWKGASNDPPHVQLPDLKKKTDTASNKGKR